MRNLLSLPSFTEDDAVVRMADWVELAALLSDDRSSSKEELKKALVRESDSLESDGRVRRNESEERLEGRITDVFKELEDRIHACGNSDSTKPSYPFVLDTSVSLLTMRSKEIDFSGMLYLFLLAVTRGDMSSKGRVLDRVDPTKVFEKLCADVLRCFWGGVSSNSDAMLFGTARATTAGERKFQANINSLCEALQEGNGWRSEAQAPGGGDGRLDIVVWRRFNDRRQGALVGFAQCKTGDHWTEHLTKLTPRTFSDKYMKTSLVIDPIRLYMIPSRISRHRWREYTSDGGLLLDRCRIVQFAETVDASIHAECRRWLDAVIKLQLAHKAAIAQ